MSPDPILIVVGSGAVGSHTAGYLLREEATSGFRFARERGWPYIGVSAGVDEIGPEVSGFMQDPALAAVVLGTEWRVGPTSVTALTRRVGRYIWRSEEAAKTGFRAVDGFERNALAISPIDVLALASATNAPNVEFNLAECCAKALRAVLGSRPARHAQQAVGGTPRGPALRPASIQTTMNVYGKAMRDTNRQAHSKVVEMLMRSENSRRTQPTNASSRRLGTLDRAGIPCN